MFLHTIILTVAINFIYCQQVNTLDCSSFTYDYDVIPTLPFFLPFNPMSKENKSYAMMDTANNAVELVIYNQKYVPINIFCLKNLRVLKVINTPFLVGNGDYASYKVPDELRNLKSLTTLVIENSNVGGNFTNSLTQISSLIELRIINSFLKYLPSLANQTGLSILDLHGNPINQLLGAENLHFITYVRLDRCAFTSLPKFTVLSGACYHMCQYHVQYHKYYPHLIHLNVSGCQLAQIFDINRYKKLQELDISHNALPFIPPSISELAPLKKLWINDNQLVYISHDIFKLKNLEYVNMVHNQFYPGEVVELKSGFATNLPKATVIF